MERQVFDNAEALIGFLTKLTKRGEYVFRGYSTQDQMVPNLLRNNVARLELELLSKLEKYGAQYISPNNSIDFLADAQHYGLSTRLLDFTYNPFVALYFALFKNKPNNATFDEDNTYYYIRYADLSSQILFKQLPKSSYLRASETTSLTKNYADSLTTLNSFLESINDDRLINDLKAYNYEPKLIDDKYVRNVKGYIESVYWDYHHSEIFKRSIVPVSYIDAQVDKFRDRRILFLEPNQSNQRIVMQQGLFLFPYELDKDMLSNMIERNTKLILIHKGIRRDLQSYLDTLGIDAYRLMPDLSSVCEAVERNVKANNPKNNFKTYFIS